MIILASFGGLLTLGGVGQLFCYWDGIFRESGVVQLPVGVLLLFLSASCILAFMRGETWRLTINDGILSWSYPRWPKSVGNWLLVTFSDATTQRIMLVGSPHRVRDFLVNHCPHISMTFREYD
eukprot:TRINITY_DN4288_c0_g1_i7.p1 TRINITY_DN4288_c0_g1~~TRINITY_DN4288_c0_g1_i7.p1  ORF type:complete len:123 (-),score=1.65 TRINITY_DN4288_c0_g1_i7:103-471(-)